MSEFRNGEKEPQKNNFIILDGGGKDFHKRKNEFPCLWKNSSGGEACEVETLDFTHLHSKK